MILYITKSNLNISTLAEVFLDAVQSILFAALLHWIWRRKVCVLLVSVLIRDDKNNYLHNSTDIPICDLLIMCSMNQVTRMFVLHFYKELLCTRSQLYFCQRFVRNNVFYSVLNINRFFHNIVSESGMSPTQLQHYSNVDTDSATQEALNRRGFG